MKMLSCQIKRELQSQPPDRISAQTLGAHSAAGEHAAHRSGFTAPSDVRVTRVNSVHGAESRAPFLTVA